jgi:hypothetical protein
MLEYIVAYTSCPASVGFRVYNTGTEGMIIARLDAKVETG